MFSKINKMLDFKSSLSHNLFYMIFGSSLLFLMSQMSIPMKPVPITLQTVGVMFIGLTFDRKAAIGAVLTYLGMGAIGFPVFSQFSAGPAVLFGPTGGYLIGFLPAVMAMIWVREKITKETILNFSLNCLAGTAVVFLFGISWLSTFLGFEKAIMMGFVPFIIPGFLKAGFLALMMGYFKTGR